MMATATAPAPIGHNGPPAPTPFETIKLHIDDMFETAQGFLDGDPILTQAQADDVDRLLDEARKARSAADAQRKIEAKPFDDGKAAVQALWTPYSDEKKGKCALIAETCKKALAPFLIAKQAAIDAEAARLRKIAEDAMAAAQAARTEAAGNLAATQQSEDALEFAAKQYRAADKLSNTRAQANGGSRATSLRSVWTAALSDSAAALRHYREHQPDALKAWLVEQANKDVRSGARSISGFTITEERVPV
jgi:hypothetical protein